MNERIDNLLVKAGARFGGDGVVYDTFDPKKFAELVAAHEREECALLCINIANKPSNVILGVAIDCAAAIRARSNT